MFRNMMFSPFCSLGVAPAAAPLGINEEKKRSGRKNPEEERELSLSPCKTDRSFVRLVVGTASRAWKEGSHEDHDRSGCRRAIDRFGPGGLGREAKERHGDAGTQAGRLMERPGRVRRA